MALLTNINGKFSVSDAGAVTFNNAFTFPTADGTANYVLKTNGSGQLAWAADNDTGGTVKGTGTATRVAFWSASDTITSDADLYWDNTNKRLGIGTDSPTSYYSGADNLVIKQDSGEGGMSIVTANDTTGAIYFADGTSGNEQYRGGIGYTHSTDKLFLVSGGQTRVWMNDSGNVGIGEDNPQENLHITATTPVFRLEGGSHSYQQYVSGTSFYIRDVTNSSNRIILDSSGNVGIGVTPESWGTGGDTRAIQISTMTSLSEAFDGTQLASNFYFDGTNDKYIQSDFATSYLQIDGSHRWRYAASGTADANITWSEAMRIDTSGNVGIGTDSPGYTLEIAGPSTTSFAYQRTGVSANKWGFHSDNDATYWQNLTSGNLLFTLQNGGNVGIGTTSPTRTLHVVGGDGGTGTHIAQFEGRSGVVGMYVRGDGNVGIGTTSPISKLDIRGVLSFPYISTVTGTTVVKFSEATDDEFVLKANLTGFGATGNSMSFGSGVSGWASDIMTWRGDGNVGIGTASPSARLDVIGVGLSSLFRVSNTDADATTKYGTFMGRHYTNSEENITGMLLTSSSSVTGGAVSIGGGITSANAVNEIKFYTAANNTTLTGSERMRITSTGNVGIGTTGPFSTLQVGGNTFTGANGMYVDARVGISNHGSLTGMMLASTYNDPTYPEYGLVFVQGASTSSYNVWSISPDGPAKGSGLSFIYKADATNIHNQTPQVYFEGSTGNVGIGTTTPTAYDTTATRLHVKNDSAGSGSVSEVARFEGSSDADGSGGVVRLTTSNDRGIYFEGGRTGSVPYGIIGTTEYNGAKTVAITLDSSGNTTFTGTINSDNITVGKSDGNNSSISLTANTGNWTFTNVQSSRNLEISDSDGTGTVMTINTSGNVGIGTTSPSDKLSVYNGSYAVNIGGYSASWSGNTIYPTIYSSNPDRWIMITNPHVPYLENGVDGYTGSTAGARVRFASDSGSSGIISWDAGVPHYGGTDTFTIGRSDTALVTVKNNGNVGIGTTSPGAKLQVKVGSAFPLHAGNACGNVGIGVTSTDISGNGLQPQLTVKGNISYGYNNYSSVANTWSNALNFSGYPAGLYQVNICKQSNASAYIIAQVKWSGTAGTVINTVTSFQYGITFSGTQLQSIINTTTDTSISVQCLVTFESCLP